MGTERKCSIHLAYNQLVSFTNHGQSGLEDMTKTAPLSVALYNVDPDVPICLDIY